VFAVKYRRSVLPRPFRPFLLFLFRFSVSNSANPPCHVAGAGCPLCRQHILPVFVLRHDRWSKGFRPDCLAMT
jgi:hypothetical protein